MKKRVREGEEWSGGGLCWRGRGRGVGVGGLCGLDVAVKGYKWKYTGRRGGHE